MKNINTDHEIRALAPTLDGTRIIRGTVRSNAHDIVGVQSQSGAVTNARRSELQTDSAIQGDGFDDGLWSALLDARAAVPLAFQTPAPFYMRPAARKQ